MLANVDSMIKEKRDKKEKQKVETSPRFSDNGVD